MKKTITLIAILLVVLIQLQAQDINNALDLFQKGQITRTEMLAVIDNHHGKNETPAELALQYLEQIEQVEGQPLAMVDLSIITKAYKWLKEKQVLKMVGLFLNPDCKDLEEMYIKIGKHVVDTQVNQFLIQHGEEPIQVK